MKRMEQNKKENSRKTRYQVETAYYSERKQLTTRLRSMGRSLEDAEDMVHDLYAELLERIPFYSEIKNISAWLNSLLTKRLIDVKRHEQVRKKTGETDVAEETLREIISGTGLNPLDNFIRESLTEALNDAISLLPEDQKAVIEGQVFGGMSFTELALKTGVSADTLKARKRYAVKSLTKALAHWIES